MPGEVNRGIHVAIIMDGNGRWAERRGLPRAAGHRAGVGTVRRIVEHALDVGIGRLTLYAFSSDNWRRPAAEVQSIFWLLRAFLRLETKRLCQRGARLEFIGRRDRLAPAVLSAIESAESATAAGTKLLVCVAIDYSSRHSIARAAADAVAALRTHASAPLEPFQSRLTVCGPTSTRTNSTPRWLNSGVASAVMAVCRCPPVRPSIPNQAQPYFDHAERNESSSPHSFLAGAIHRRIGPEWRYSISAGNGTPLA